MIIKRINNLTFIGRSLAAHETGIMVQEMNIMLDCGIYEENNHNAVFITHCHSDHIMFLPLKLVRKQDGKVLQVYAPDPMLEDIYNYIDIFFRMSKNKTRVFVHKKYQLISATNNMICGKYIVDTFKCDHTVPCVAYGFSEPRKKLKDEYKGLTGHEIKKLRDDGIEITYDIMVKLFCFVGDSTETPLLNEDIFEYPLIITECTFIADDDIDKAKKKKHTHIVNLEPIILSHLETKFLLYHFSKKYTKEAIQLFFDEKNYPNVELFQ